MDQKKHIYGHAGRDINCYGYFEGVCVNSRHPGPRRVWKVGVWGALAATTSAGSAGSGGSGGEFQIVQKPYVFTAKVTRVTLRCNVFLTFSYPSHLKHLVLRAFLEDGLPEMLSILGVLAERGIKKSKKHHAIAPIAKTPRKVPGRENIDCENTMNMKMEYRKSYFS